jgi:hypothetical protein
LQSGAGAPPSAPPPNLNDLEYQQSNVCHRNWLQLRQPGNTNAGADRERPSHCDESALRYAGN